VAFGQCTDPIPIYPLNPPIDSRHFREDILDGLFMYLHTLLRIGII
jgi:hypothetical protein